MRYMHNTGEMGLLAYSFMVATSVEDFVSHLKSYVLLLKYQPIEKKISPSLSYSFVFHDLCFYSILDLSVSKKSLGIRQ